MRTVEIISFKSMGMYVSYFLINVLSAFLLCFTATVVTQDRPSYASQCWSGEKQHYRMGLRHIEAGGIGYNNGYTTLEGFFAPNPDTSKVMPFLDVQGHGFDNGQIATNVGFGIRKIVGCRVFGANVYYDYRNAANSNYNQMGFGIESLGKRWDFRVNAYVPIEKNISSDEIYEFGGFSENNMMLSQNYHFAMTGMNANFGVHFGKNKVCDFYACAGTYFYAGQIEPHIWGGKASFMVRFNKYVTLEVSNSYDIMFLNRFQVQLGFSIPFGTATHEPEIGDYSCCDTSDLLLSRMTQPVQRQEIIVLDQNQDVAAINPETGQPYRFIFVDNTSNSSGTYESPYHSLIQAQNNSVPGDILYVFPGDGTTRGMDKGITLQRNQNFWGSGINHTLQTSQGSILLPAQSTIAPMMTNIDINTLGDGITLSSVNQVSGFTIVDALNNGIFGSNVQNLSVDHCTFQGTNLYCINTASAGQATVSITNNTMTNNKNGSTFDFSGSSNLLISGNTITGTTSVSSFPIAIAADASPLTATMTNNNISNNEIGAFQLVLNDTSLATLTISNNTITGNNAGEASSLGSAIVINPLDSTIGNCDISLVNNIISNNHDSRNQGNTLYCLMSGGFNDFNVTATNNNFTGNGGGLVFANTATTFTLNATDNIISNNNDSGIAVIGTTVTTANMTIANNQITGNTNSGNGIALSHSGTELNLAVTNNSISGNEGSGILMYSSVGIENATVNIENNTINNNQNLGTSATGGIDLEQFTNLFATITNNTLTDNVGQGLYVGFTLPTPFADLTMSGNNSNTDYMLAGPVVSPADGTFNLAPCNVEIVNNGTILTSGVITPVQSCPADVPCP